MDRFAVVGNPDHVVLNKRNKLNKNDVELIKNEIRKNCSPKHVPHKIIQIPEIPRTKSGKIVELAVKKKSLARISTYFSAAVFKYAY